MLINFSKQDNTFFTVSNYEQNYLIFALIIMCFWWACTHYILDTNKILRAIDLLFGSNFFQSSLCDEKCIPFRSYWLIKDLIFDILWGFFWMLWQFNATVKAYCKQLSSLFFCIYYCFFSFWTFWRIYSWWLDSF